MKEERIDTEVEEIQVIASVDPGSAFSVEVDDFMDILMKAKERLRSVRVELRGEGAWESWSTDLVIVGVRDRTEEEYLAEKIRIDAEIAKKERIHANKIRKLEEQLENLKNQPVRKLHTRKKGS